MGAAQHTIAEISFRIAYARWNWRMGREKRKRAKNKHRVKTDEMKWTKDNDNDMHTLAHMRAWARPLVHSFSLENVVVVVDLFRSKGVRLRLFISKHIHLLIKLILCIHFVYAFFSLRFSHLRSFCHCFHRVHLTHAHTMIWNWRCRLSSL